ncbi:iron-sulfur cluster assembly scaffold protein [Patescibacteria group bacterium]|nr:iron-sulfur cluster assembly scaffold protein [Patescibacteria group bacterium]
MLYSKEIIKHFKNPKNLGKIKNADGIGKVGNPLCGDVMELSFKIGKNKKKQEVIKDIKFETMGCAVAIANTSLLTIMVKGRTIKQALEITKQDLMEKLGQPLPAIKIHCSLLAIDALYEAIYNYLKKGQEKIPEKLEKIHQKIGKENKEIGERY